MTLAFESGWLRRVQPSSRGAGIMEEEGIFYFLRSEPRVRTAVAEAASRLLPSAAAARALADAAGSQHVLSILAARPLEAVGVSSVPDRACLEVRSSRDAQVFEMVLAHNGDRLSVVSINALGPR